MNFFFKVKIQSLILEFVFPKEDVKIQSEVLNFNSNPLIDSMVTLPPRALRCAGWRQSRICSSTAPPPCWPLTNSAAAQLWPPAPPRTAHGADHSRVGPTANCEPERSLPVKRTPTERLMGKKVKQKTVLDQGRNNNVYLGGRMLIIFT